MKCNIRNALLAHHNPEINWRTGEVQIMRCPDKCRKQWRTRRQMKLGWQKQKIKKKKREQEKKGEFRKLIVEEEMEIVRVIEKKKDKEEDLIDIRTVEEIVPKWFHKYLKMFEKKESERMPTRKT